jgi:hypothetical protein
MFLVFKRIKFYEKLANAYFEWFVNWLHAGKLIAMVRWQHYYLRIEMLPVIFMYFATNSMISPK